MSTVSAVPCEELTVPEPQLKTKGVILHTQRLSRQQKTAFNSSDQNCCQETGQPATHTNTFYSYACEEVHTVADQT